MLAPPEVPRNAESAQSEGRAEVMGKSAAEDSIKAGARRASALVGLYSLSSGTMPAELNFALTEF